MRDSRIHPVSLLVPNCPIAYTLTLTSLPHQGPDHLPDICIATIVNMPTKTYRFYDPAHQASCQETLQSSDCTVHYQKGQKESIPWALSSARREFEDAQRGLDMSHITPHKSWIQHDLTDATPSYQASSTLDRLFLSHLVWSDYDINRY
jgi:hypothetical protein